MGELAGGGCVAVAVGIGERGQVTGDTWRSRDFPRAQAIFHRISHL